MKLTAKQQEAQRVIAGPATHILLVGGSRSGKTFLHVRNTALRALKAPESRHAILRFRFNHLKASIIHDTFPKVMRVAFPGVKYHLDKSDWFAKFKNGAEIWFGGLDDKERTEKILGSEYATIYLNECSQISLAAREMTVTRLAQLVHQRFKNAPPSVLKPRMFYDLNPGNKGHWSYRLFFEKRDPETKRPIANAADYVHFQINPKDNEENLSAGYMDILNGLSPRMRKRFLDGEYADANPNALFNDIEIDKHRVIDEPLPDMQRIVVAVDPSGSGDSNNENNDDIGIVVAGLGVDGIGYLLEDCTVKAGPATWGRIATQAFERWAADLIVGESNFGGDMVRHVIQTARPGTKYEAVTASRGKVVRAEPISALVEQGKIRHAGQFLALEDELCKFSTTGYLGEESPNRADAYVWAFTKLMLNAPQEIQFFG